MRVLAAMMVVFALTPAGCAAEVSGRAVRGVAQSMSPLRADDTDQVLVTPAQLQNITGVKLQLDADQSRPISGTSAVPACSALDATGMAAFVGDQALGFHVLLFTDSAQHDLVVAQAAAVYPDARTAATAFNKAATDARSCDGQSALSTGGDAAWKFTVSEANSDTVRWDKDQIGIPMVWNCGAEARLRNNAIVQAMACAGDDESRVTVTTMMDRMSATVWELSSR